MNRVFLEGRLTADPAKKEANGTPLAEFSIAVSGPNGQADFFDVVVFGGWATNLRAAKGTPVVIEGRLRQETWTDKESGSKRSRVRVHALSVKEIARSARLEEEEPAQGAATTS